VRTPGREIGRSSTSLPRPQPQELAFLEAIAENPGDDTPLLVLGDWLEERDDPRRAELHLSPWQVTGSQGAHGAG
jgi:uncharacterized protein (TIGR02996 family)